MLEYLILGIVVVVLFVALLVGFVVVPRRRHGRSVDTSKQPDTGQPDTGQPGAGQVAEGTGAGGMSTLVPPSAAPTEAPVPTETSPAPDAAPPAEAAPGTSRPELDVPEETAGRMVRLRSRLSRSQSTLGRGLLSLLSRDRLDDDAWEEVEDTLLAADVGVKATTEIVEGLRERTAVLGTASAGELRALLAEALVAAIDPDVDRSLHTDPTGGTPAVALVVGVNGTGKTTTCGKLARVLVADGRTVLLGAADTFRAAAADQLANWGTRVGAETVRGAEGADPASVAFETVRRGVESGVDTVLIDTAGRLHTKAGLMDELGKVKRVVERQGPVAETLLVLDATTGQNGLIQARVFTEVVDVTGVVLTKLDGTAKGGIVIAVQRELGIPVKLIGLGEGADDLAPFDAEQFVDALLGEG